MTIKLNQAGQPAYKKLEMVYKYLQAFLSDANNAANTMSADKLFELAHRSANVKQGLLAYKNDVDLIRYAQKEADNNPAYAEGYNVRDDFKEVLESLDAILIAIVALDYTNALTMSEEGRRVWANIDASAVVPHVNRFKAAVSLA